MFTYKIWRDAKKVALYKLKYKHKLKPNVVQLVVNRGLKMLFFRDISGFFE